MSRKIRVMKFGGTSVATPEARFAAARRVVSARELGYDPVVVVSAVGRRGQPYATDTLLNELRNVDPVIRPDEREMDLMLACGEIFSAVIFSQTLRSLGVQGRSLRGGQAGIRTDGVYGNARIASINPAGILNAIRLGYVPVVCGFQGTFAVGGEPGGELTTLGRGGSDTTAAALGAALDAECIEIFTDVDGVKTADPDFVAHAPTLRTVSYEEVAEIAHLGAKVLHPRAAEIAMKFQIPLWVKNTFSDAEGTLITSAEEIGERRATGVTHSGKLIYLQFDLGMVLESHRAELQATVYSMMSRYGLNTFMINLSPNSIGFAVQRDQFPIIEDLLDGLVVPLNTGSQAIYVLQIGSEPSKETETQLHLMQSLGPVQTVPLEKSENSTVVSLVGRQFLQQPGVFHDVLQTLSAAKITVLQTSDSDLSLSCLIPESETSRAVSLLHEAFGLSNVY